MINWEDASMIRSLAHLTTLSISLTDRIFVFDGDEEADEDLSECEEEEGDVSSWQPSGKDAEIVAASQDESNFSGLANLIAACPRLEDIELHYHSVAWPKTRLFNCFRRDQILTHMAGLANLPPLKCCRLRGITARQVDLLQFIRKAKVAEVFIESIHLAAGTLRPIIDYCISESGYVRKLHIDTVYEKCEEGYRGLVHFLGEGESKRYAGTFDVGTELLNREGDGRTRAVSYYVQRPIADATPATCDWTRRQREEYN
ncbi:hypothetical protein K4F52_010120 [Lecanicillium sp. MT-2017a]|nr:hypothetical protein K4F52_010120 [Lecanicillium sp. MT-2017a]